MMRMGWGRQRRRRRMRRGQRRGGGGRRGGGDGEGGATATGAGRCQMRRDRRQCGRDRSLAGSLRHDCPPRNRTRQGHGCARMHSSACRRREHHHRCGRKSAPWCQPSRAALGSQRRCNARKLSAQRQSGGWASTVERLRSFAFLSSRKSGRWPKSVHALGLPWGGCAAYAP